MGKHVPGGFAQYVLRLAGLWSNDPRPDADLLAAFTRPRTTTRVTAPRRASRAQPSGRPGGRFSATRERGGRLPGNVHCPRPPGPLPAAGAARGVAGCTSPAALP